MGSQADVKSRGQGRKLVMGMLKPVRVHDISLVPSHLIQISGMPWTEERLRTLWDLINNQLNLLYVFVDDEQKVRGWLWSNVMILTEKLFLQAISFDKDIRKKAADSGTSIMKEIAPWIVDLYKYAGCKGVIFATQRHKGMMRVYKNMSPYTHVLMEGY